MKSPRSHRVPQFCLIAATAFFSGGSFADVVTFGNDIFLGNSATGAVASSAQREDLAFTAPRNTTVDTAHMTFIAGAALGGTAVVSILADDGTAAHRPTGSPLASATLTLASTDVNRTVALDASVALNAGSIYHMVFSSPDATATVRPGLRVHSGTPYTVVNTIAPYGDPMGYYMRARSTDSGATWTNAPSTSISWALTKSASSDALGQPYSTQQLTAFGQDTGGNKNWVGQRFKYTPQAGAVATGSASSLAIQFRHNNATPGALSDDIRIHLVTVKSQSYVTDGSLTTLTAIPGREVYSGILLPSGSTVDLSPGQLYTINIPESDRPVLINGQSYMMLIETATSNTLTQLSFPQGSVAGFDAGAINGNFQGMVDGFVVNSGTASIGANGLPVSLQTADLGGLTPTIFRDTRFQTKADPASMWNQTSGGTWSNAGNWTGAVPAGAGSIANLASSILANSTITNDAARSLGHLVIDNANSYTIDGEALTFDKASAFAPSIDVVQGNHTVSAPVAFAKSTAVTVTSGSSLTLSALADGGTTSLNKYGAGSLTVNRVRMSGLMVDEGTVSILAGKNNARTSVVGTLNIASTGKLNLNDQDMIITGTAAASVRSSLKSGFAGGSWNGNGINSALAAAASGGSDRTAVGYGTATQILGGAGSFSGQSVAASDVLLRYTWSGDSNLDGKVNTIDFNNLAGHFNEADKVWSEGDFNYDDTVDSTDFNALAGNYGKSMAVESASLGSVVPEPAGLTLLAVAAGQLGLRRRRR